MGNVGQRTIRGKRCVSLMAMVSLTLLLSASYSFAGLVPIQNKYEIERNGSFLDEEDQSLSSSSEYLPGGLVYDWKQDSYPKNKSIAHSGSASGDPQTNNPQIYQHVYAYCLPDTGTVYQVGNSTGNTRTLMVTEEDAGKKTGKKLRIKSDVVLDGSLLLVKESGIESFEGLLASFDVLVTREYEKNGKAVTKTLAKGTVTLVGLKNGKIKLKTTGKINKKLFTINQEDDDIYRIDFDDAEIAYRTSVRVGEEFSITTRVSSLVENQGYGTGAEVIFAPDLPNLPSPALPGFKESGQIPEPITPLLLLTGTLGTRWIMRRKRHVRKSVSVK